MLAAARNLPPDKQLFSFVLVEYERKMCLNLKVISHCGERDERGEEGNLGEGKDRGEN